MNNLLKIFVSPGKVFDEFKDDISAFPAVITLAIACFILVGTQWYLLSDDEIREMVHAEVEEAAEILGNFTRMMGVEIDPESEDTSETGSNEDSSKTEFNEVFQEALDEQVAQMTNEEGLSRVRAEGLFSLPFNVLIGMGIGFVSLAFYFFVVGRFLRTPFSFGQWFAFVCWSMLPCIVHWIYFDLVLILTDVRFVDANSYVSLLALIGWRPGFGPAIALSTLLIIYIQSYGLQRWSEKPLGLCVGLASIPWVFWAIFYLGWSTIF